MPYVQRNGGTVCGLFPRLQPGFAEEFLLADHPDVLAYVFPTQDARAVGAIDSVDRLQFEVMFDMENRMRAREGIAAVSRAAYRTALINRWKALNP